MKARRFRSLVLFLLILSSSALLMSPAQASADSAYIEQSDTTYEVQPDGAIKVTAQLLYRSKVKSRTMPTVAIPKQIALGGGKEAVWTITDLKVASPTADPVIVYRNDEATRRGVFGIYALGATFQEADEASYTITYMVHDALAAGASDSAELTIPNYIGSQAPWIRNWSVTMTAVGLVTEPRCGASSGSCTTTSVEHGVRFEGPALLYSGLFTASASFPGQHRTEQRIVKIWPDSAEVESSDIAVTVDANGTANVVADVVVNMPAQVPATVRMCVLRQARAGIGRQYSLDVSPGMLTNVTAQKTMEAKLSTSLSDEVCDIFELDNRDEQTHFTVAYTVKHAARIEGEKAIFFFAPPRIVPHADMAKAPNVTITMPGAISAATCSEAYDPDRRCTGAYSPKQISESTVTYRGDSYEGRWVEVQTSKSAMPGAQPVYFSTPLQKIAFAALGGMIATVLSGAAVIGLQKIHDARKPRALPPELPVLAGAELTDTRNSNRATMSTLVQLNLDNVIHLGIDPVTLSPNDGSDDGSSLAGSIYGIVSTFSDADAKRRKELVTKISQSVKKELEKEHRARAFMLPKRKKRLWLFLLLGALAVCDLGLLISAILFSADILPGFIFAVVLVLIGVLCLVDYDCCSIRPITAEAKTYRAQIEGFTDYLAQDTLAGLDETVTEEIYARGLPWAVYLDCADQWINKCRAAADARGLDYSTWPMVDSTTEQWKTFAQFIENKSAVPDKGSAVPDKGEVHKPAATKKSDKKPAETEQERDTDGPFEFEQPEWLESARGEESSS